MSGIKVKVSPQSSYRVSVNNIDGTLSATAPISLRNVVREGSLATVENLEDIGNVSVVNKTDGSTLQFNSENSRYEIRLADLDGGTF